ncbi:hypothetical protein CMO89_02135 [Candidatus Woesearchaeota archaeon]|nr:hypothetical protein [Candidatus Woesearchaeota archaeon]
MKEKLILMLLIVLLSITACQRVSTKTQDTKVYTGTEGVVMRFLPDMPPSQIYSSDTLNFNLEIKNKGAYDAGTVPNTESGSYTKFLKFYISGYDKSIFTGDIDGGTDPIFGNWFFWEPELEGKSEFNPEGGIVYKDFSTKIGTLPEGMDSFKTNFLMTACYTYETLAVSSVCIDPVPYSTVAREKACAVSDVSLSGGQGAPVVITRIEEEAAKGKVRFKIYFENKGNGKIFDMTHSERSAKDSDNVPRLKCNPYSEEGLGYDDIDKITLNKVSVGSEDITSSCKPVREGSSTIRLIDGRGFIICEKTVSGGTSAFLTPLEIKLSYGYTSSIQKEVEILKTLE